MGEEEELAMRRCKELEVVTSGSVVKFGLIFILVSFLFLVNGVSGQSCICNGVSCTKNLTSSDCPSGRVIFRNDCNCCSVCAKQLTDECNQKELPCDQDFGLICGKDLKCQAEKPCGDDTECSVDRFCFGGACADPCKVLPDVCNENGPKNGICTVRNHRALCSCAVGETLLETKCVAVSDTDESEEKIGAVCEHDGITINPGEMIYMEKCSKLCECRADDGKVICKEASGVTECDLGFIPMSSLGDEMTEACKALVRNMNSFDGCCVPERCQNVTDSNHHPSLPSKSRDYKLSAEFQNNLGDDEEEESSHHHNKNDGDDELMPSREMLLSKEDHKVPDELGLKVPLKKDTTKSKKFLNQGIGSSVMMKVTVSKTTPHSASINLPVHEKGAILSIALSSQLNTQENENDDRIWKKHMIPPGLPTLVLSDLLPNTSYTVTYSVGDKIYPAIEFLTAKADEMIERGRDDRGPDNSQTPKEALKDTREDEDDDDKGFEITTQLLTEETTEEQIQINSDETIQEPNIKNLNETEIKAPMNESDVSTTTESSEGCLSNGTFHTVGTIVFEGCDQRCECMKHGEMKCIERCSIPFFKNGSFAHDPLCFEEPSGIDECCVIVACARNSHAGIARELTINPCDTVKCGPNANCRHEVSPAGIIQSENPNDETLCFCNENFLGDPYDEVKGCEPVVLTSTMASTPSSSANPTLVAGFEKKIEGCVSNNKTFEYGEEHLDGCSYKCHCEESGEFLCLPRCNYRHDEDTKTPSGCEIQKDPLDPECCELLVCAGESAAIRKKPKVPMDGCVYKNQTYEKDEKFFDGCHQQCMCYSNGDVTCQPRCPPIGPSAQLEKDCITLPDPTDNCCTVTVCGNQTVNDVMKKAVELERKRLASTDRARILLESSETSDETTIPSSSIVRQNSKPIPSLSVKISMTMPINDSAIMVSIRIPEDEMSSIEEDNISIFYSMDKAAPFETWKKMISKVKDLFVEGSDEIHTIIGGLLPETEYFFKVKVNGSESNTGSAFTKFSNRRPLTTDGGGKSHEDHSVEDTKDHSGPASNEVVCHYKSKVFAAGEEFYDGCDEYCVCEDSGAVQCIPIECPTDFGLDLLDSHCVKWEPIISEGEKYPPNCCPEMKCVMNSSCSYQGFTFTNFEEIPPKLTGCEKRCYCEYGNVTCQNYGCPPISTKPPTNLPCPLEMATTVKLPHDECCMSWVCRGQNQTTNGTQPLLLPNTTHHSTLDQNRTGNKNMTSFQVPAHRPLNHHLIHPGIIYDEEDQFVPPSTGNQPTVIPLDKLHPQQLQELLHQLSAQNEAGSPHSPHPFGQGIYVSVKSPEEIQDLERHGAKVVGQADDNSFVLFLPADGHRVQRPFLPYPSSNPNIPHPSFTIPGTDHFPFGPHFQHTPSGLPHDEITGVMIRPLNESTLHIDFTVSPVLVGLQGAVEVLYTNEFSTKPDPAQWEKQLFQQPEDIIDNSHLQLFLSGLKADSEYHVQIQVIISNIHNAPVSDVFVIRTPPTAPPPEIKIDSEIKVIETTSRSVEISWRKFTDFESSLIDGVQIKYKAYDDQLYATTELIHRSIFSYKLTNLQPGKKYEVDLLLVPFTNQTTELKSENAIHIETPAEVDDFSFTIALETGKISEQTAELIWEGVPFPEDKFVNIYQVLYQSDNQKEQKSYFKVANRETNKKAVLTDLKPGTRYRVWLEAFLTNGKKKRSNVIDVLTKVGNLPSPEKSELEANLLGGSRSQGAEQTTSYYGALVALAIVAAVSIIGIIVLLMILIKKQNHSKLPINDRKSESSYDNPSFKNYDIEANGINKPSEL